jgi:hypothetical protein
MYFWSPKNNEEKSMRFYFFFTSWKKMAERLIPSLFGLSLNSEEK